MTTNTKMKYLPIAAFAVVALSLAGCGGGGGSPVATMMPEPEPPVVEPEPPVVEPEPPVVGPAACEGTEACLAAAKTALEEATAAFAALNENDDSTLGQIAAAEAAVMAAQGAVDEAQTAHDVATAVPEPAPPTPGEMADTAYNEYLAAVVNYRAAYTAYALNPNATTLAALSAAAVAAVTEANEAEVLAEAGSVEQLRRAQIAVANAGVLSGGVATIKMGVADAATRVMDLADAAIAATAYADAKAAYDAVKGMTQENLDTLTAAADEAGASAATALLSAANGSAEQLTEAQAAVTAATEALVVVDDIVMALQNGIAPVLTAYNDAKTAHTTAKGTYDADESPDNANALKAAADALHAEATVAKAADALGASDEQNMALAAISVTDTEDYVTAANKAVELANAPPSLEEMFATAQDASDDAVAARETATETRDNAVTASGNIDTVNANGDSMQATANAQTVLDAPAAMAKFVEDAEAALKSATEAMVYAEDLPDNNAAKSTLINALEAAIDVAKAEVTATTKARDSLQLETAVTLVLGNDEDMPMSPADHGKAVAEDIAGALMPATVDDGGRGVRAMIAVAEPATAVFMDEDHQGHTWAEIVGEDNIKEMRLASTDTDTDPIEAASLEGMPLSLIGGDTPPGVGIAEDGAEYESTKYRGIPGTVFCAGADCVVSMKTADEVSKLTGSWYFTPTKGDEEEWYIATATGGVTMYVAETLYARYGHWLTMDHKGDAVIHTYAVAGVAATNSIGLDFAANDELAGSATYTGPAAGMSVHKTVDEDGEPTSIYSGAFTADVSLVARFGTAPTLGGTISGFEGGNAVDADWEVELERKMLLITGAFVDGKTVASGRDGVWSATSYGVADARPTGIFGNFNAHFSDGHAAGAYVTRK